MHAAQGRHASLKTLRGAALRRKKKFSQRCFRLRKSVYRFR